MKLDWLVALIGQGLSLLVCSVAPTTAQALQQGLMDNHIQTEKMELMELPNLLGRS